MRPDATSADHGRFACGRRDDTPDPRDRRSARPVSDGSERAGDSAQKDWAAGLHALKRIVDPAEIASAALLLASPMSSFVTGSALHPDGGNAAVK